MFAARTTRWRAAAVPVAVVALVTAASVALRVNSPAWLVSTAVHDDALFARLAGNAVDERWLGNFDKLTLAKGPAYPLFIAAVYEVHLPLKLAEHALHLVAGAMMAIAVWRVCRSRLAAVVTYAAIALDPAYLGASAAKVTREGFYGSLCLMLVAGLLIFLTYVPSLVRRGPAWSVPTVALGSAAFGAVAATYYLCRDERAWLLPALAVAAAAGVATWRGTGPVTPAHGAVIGGALVLTTGSFVWSAHWVTDRNEQAYGTSVGSDLVDGEIARAYTQWQRVDVGDERRLVPVSRAQRDAVYAISPSATELEPYLEGSGTGWFAPGCAAADVCDDYMGAHFVWVIRDAADATGHMVSGAEAQRFFGELADDIEAACNDDDLPCRAPGIGPMPPLSRVSPRALARSLSDTTGNLLSYDVAEPARGLSSGGDQQQWDTMVRPLRGIDGDQAAYLAAEDRALDRQGPVSALMVTYRWGGRIGVVLAGAGIVVALATRAGRRQAPAVLVTAAMLTAVASRVGLVALIDATSYPASRVGVYILPGVAFLVAFVVLGCWLLAASVRGTLEGRSAPSERVDAVPVPPEPAPVPPPTPSAVP